MFTDIKTTLSQPSKIHTRKFVEVGVLSLLHKVSNRIRLTDVKYNLVRTCLSGVLTLAYLFKKITFTMISNNKHVAHQPKESHSANVPVTFFRNPKVGSRRISSLTWGPNDTESLCHRHHPSHKICQLSNFVASCQQPPWLYHWSGCPPRGACELYLGHGPAFASTRLH